MAKKYIIEMTEKQARILSWACDTLPRLIEGQHDAYRSLFEFAWENRCLEATGKSMDKEFEGGWQEMRNYAEYICKEIKRRFWGKAPNVDNGIHYDHTADIIWDMYQVIRHALWLDDANPNKSRMTVDASPAMQFGEEPLIKVTSKEEKK